MSQENVEATRSAYEAWIRGDRETLRELLGDEVVFEPALAPLTERAVYRGADEVAAFLFDEVPQILQGFSGEIVEIRELGKDTVLAVIRSSGQAARADLNVDQHFWHVLRFRGGDVVSIVSYTDESEALEAVGHRE